MDGLDGYLAFFCAIQSTMAGVIRHTGWNNRQQTGCLQAKLICFHLWWKSPKVQFKNCVCLPITLPMSLSLWGCVYLCWFNVFVAVHVCFSGGRNIVVTGSGFDLIQTAVMKVQGENSAALEVCVILFLFSLIICTFSIVLSICWLPISLPVIISSFPSLTLSLNCVFPATLCLREFLLLYLFPPHGSSTVHRSSHISWAHDYSGVSFKLCEAFPLFEHAHIHQQTHTYLHSLLIREIS